MKTSITTAQAKKFFDAAATGKELHCDSITGFHLRKNSKGASWRLSYQDAGRKRRRVTIGGYPAMKPQEAAQIALDWRTGITKGEADPIAKREALAAQKRTQSVLEVGRYFSEVYAPALEQKCGKENARATLNKIKQNFGSLWKVPMNQLTLRDIRNWEAEMMCREFTRKGKTYKGVWHTTRKSYFGAFAAMLKYAAGQKNGHVNDEPVLDDYPLKGIKLRGATIEEKERQEQHNEAYNLGRDLLNDKQRELIQVGLKAYGQDVIAKRTRSLRLEKNQHLADLRGLEYPCWFIPFAHIARLTGMRPKDILHLRWQDIKQLHAKGSEYDILRFVPTKTKHHPNPIEVEFPILGELAEVLNKWRVQRGKPTSGLMFPSDKMALQGIEQPWDKKAYGKKWRRVLELAGLPLDIHFYSFRHNFISDWVNRV